MDTSILPPTAKGRKYEIKGLALREFAGVKNDKQRLNPFHLAHYANLLVVSFEQIEQFLSTETISELLQAGKDSWSGGACSQTLPNGKKLILLNPTHSKNRQNATLMEEISHVFLGHKPSRLAVKTYNKEGKPLARDYHAEIEEEAYSVGAAALAPYSGIKKMIAEGKTSKEIAQHYFVSQVLIEFRMKVSKLWETYKADLK